MTSPLPPFPFDGNVVGWVVSEDRVDVALDRGIGVVVVVVVVGTRGPSM